jgi:hypothetical protein
MKIKLSKTQNALAGKPEYYEPSKRNLFKKKMTGAGRAKKLREAQKNSLQKISAALGVAEQINTPELLEIAAARLAGVGEGNPVADFEFAARSYLKRISRMAGNIIPVESFWDQLLDLVKEADLALAKTFARDFKKQFHWCLVGHVHRLSMEHDQLPSSIQEFEVYRKGKKRTVVARLRNGTGVPVPDGGCPRHDPCIIFAGTQECPPIAPRDFKRIEQMDKKLAVALLGSDKFKFTVPESELFNLDTVLNVAKPFDLAGIRRELSILGFKSSRKK